MKSGKSFLEWTWKVNVLCVLVAIFEKKLADIIVHTWTPLGKVYVSTSKTKLGTWSHHARSATMHTARSECFCVDYMARSSTRRGGIKKLAFLKIKTHLRGGYPSATSQSTKILLHYKRSHAPLDFASFINDTYNASLVDDEIHSYRELLNLTPIEERELLYGFGPGC